MSVGHIIGRKCCNCFCHHENFFSDLKLNENMLLTWWLIQWMNLAEWANRKPLSETLVLHGSISQHTGQNRGVRMLPLLLTTGSCQTNLVLTGSCFYWQHKKETFKLKNCFSAVRPSPTNLPALPCPQLWPAFVLSFHIETTDSGFPLVLIKFW